MVRFKGVLKIRALKLLKMFENQWESMGVNTRSSLHIERRKYVPACVCVRKQSVRHALGQESFAGL